MHVCMHIYIYDALCSLFFPTSDDLGYEAVAEQKLFPQGSKETHPCCGYVESMIMFCVLALSWIHEREDPVEMQLARSLSMVPL